MGGRLSYPITNLTNKVAIVTGGNAGIGYETTKALAVMGAHTIIACRSEERAQTAIEQIKHEAVQIRPGKNICIDFMKMDLQSFESTKNFTLAFKERKLPLNILINNAGIGFIPKTLTKDGNELHFQVNHLSHFLMTLELLPVMINTSAITGDCRIVIVTSKGNYAGKFDPNNLNGELSYGRIFNYQNSKLYITMNGFALQRRLNNVGVTVSSVDPGLVDTKGMDKALVGNEAMLNAWKFGSKFIKPVMRSVQQGAVPSINCGVNPLLNSQQHLYYNGCTVAKPSSTSMNADLQEQLWQISIDKVKDWLSPEFMELYSSRGTL